VNKGGFSLLELIVALVIIGLMSALVMPYLAGTLGHANLKTAAKTVAASLRYARSRAVSEQLAYVALFDTETRTLRIFSETEKAAQAKAYHLPEGIYFEKARSAQGISESGLFRMMFYPSGASSGGEIILADAKNRQYAVRVHFITGVVELSN
jgi:general secretion pathway protein H